jgi:hypothetical protein
VTVPPEWYVLVDRHKVAWREYMDAQTAINAKLARIAAGTGPNPTTEEIETCELLRERVEKIHEEMDRMVESGRSKPKR